MAKRNLFNNIRIWQHAIVLIICLLSAPHFPLVLSESNVDEVSELDTALFNALGEEDIDAANAALKNGASINALSGRGKQTPLMQS